MDIEKIISLVTSIINLAAAILIYKASKSEKSRRGKAPPLPNLII